MNPFSLRRPVFSVPQFVKVAWTGLLGAVASLGVLFFLVRFWEALLVQGLPWKSRWMDLLGILIGVVAGQGLRFFYAQSCTRLGADTAARLRTRFWKRLLAAPVLPSRSEGDTGQEGPARLLKVVDALEPWYSQYLPQAFLAVAVPLLILVLVLVFDPLTGLVLGVTGPLLPVFLALIGIKAKARAEKQWKTLARLRFVFLESLHGLKTLKIFGRSQARLQELEVADTEFRTQTLSVLRTAFLSALALEWTATLGTAMVAVEVALRLMAGSLEFFPGLLVLLWTPEFYKPIRQLGLGFHASLDAKTAFKDNPQLFHTDSGSKNDSIATGVNAAVQPVVLCITSASGKAFPVAPGEPAVLTGPSGTGKTRFLLAYLGHISLENTQTSLTPVVPWPQIGWLPQHPVLFEGTVRDNLCPHGEVPETLVWEALEKVGLAQTINTLGGGLNAQVQENGRNFSGGERRRLALARLLILDRPVWILDEPLAGLDTQAAERVLDLLDAESLQRTVLHVTHHRASLLRARRIMFMQNGAIEAVGTHLELLESSAAYGATVRAAEGAL